MYDRTEIARTLAEIVAETHRGRLRMTRTRVARELTARTGHPCGPDDVDRLILAAQSTLTCEWNVTAARVSQGLGTQWLLQVVA
jgi:hypothetical protein